MEGFDIDRDGRPSSSSKRNRHATNSRKVNLTHLLNYRSERKQRVGRHRDSFFSHDNVGSGHQRHNTQYRDYSGVHKFNKQQFLQANCQFVVLDGYDYTIHKINPDLPVDWDFIEEVKFKQTACTETTCPICLEPPIAAKITRCGHIYCWTCMLHYLSLSDENCRQCPICFEPVYKRDLRSVVSQSFTNHAVEEVITMKLMIRRKECVDVEPYTSEHYNHELANIRSTSTMSSQEDELYHSHANLIIVSPMTVITKTAQRERDELLLKMELERNEQEVCFIEEALNRLAQRIEKMHQKRVNSETASRSPDQKVEHVGSVSHRASSSSGSSTNSYLFYQSNDGQHIYLNPFSTKILCQQYGNLENCPKEFKAKILQMDWVSMSDAWRKRFKYLGHLPLTCEFRLIEIDFKSCDQLISNETYQLFEAQIAMRAKERERRRREERKREKIIQVEQNRKIYGIQPSLKINLDNIEQFPSVSDERYLGLGKYRNREHNYDDDASSSGEETETNSVAQAVTESEMQTPAKITENHRDGVAPTNSSNNALSFKEIQSQEAAIALKEAADNNAGNSTTSSARRSGQSSSFAQLLVDAKSSQKGWTHNVPRVASSSAAAPTASNIQQWPNLQSSAASDDGGEELKAPTNEFTISDFLDMNVVSGKRKGKRKGVSVSKKD